VNLNDANLSRAELRGSGVAESVYDGLRNRHFSELEVVK
jgi:hypothetical protein